MSTDPIELERRAVPRVQLSTRARLVPNGWSSLEVDVVDVSARGFRAACDVVMRPDSRIAIEVAGIGEVQASVVWCSGYEFGAKFARPIKLANCTALQGADAGAWRSAPPAPKLAHEEAASRPGLAQWHLQQVSTEAFLGMKGINPLSELWHDGELAGYVWPFAGSWWADFDPNLRPIIERASSLEAVRALLQRRADDRSAAAAKAAKAAAS